ncbi:MAG: hypothetical protein E6H06_04545 [Bacteroidetes bacterium]|nr:MAG: hypothetical protein E6H06_04545 [Bacteroidota bacterium]
MRSIKNIPFSNFKNIQFSKLVKTEGRLREFNFRKSNPDAVLFFVDVTDDRSNRIFFQMKKENESWKIEPQLLPDWIIKNEEKLHEVIEEELRFLA